MKMTICKRFTFAALAFLLCFILPACSENAESTTETETITATEDGTNTNPDVGETNPVLQEPYDALAEEELLGKISGWRGSADEGKLTEKDHYTTTMIHSKKDLDPYRDFLSGFTAEDEKTILADDGGACILIELTGETEYTMYGTSSILKNGSGITIVISKEEVEEPSALHTYFLLYFPEEFYNGEVIDITF